MPIPNHRYDDGSVTIKGTNVVITLDHDAFEWLVNELPQKDAYTQILWWWLMELKKKLIEAGV